MRNVRSSFWLLLVLPSVVSAQEPSVTDVAEPSLLDVPPERLARVERDRSRACVPVLAALAELDDDLAPLLRRADRVRALAEAVSLEDSTRMAPFDGGDPLEAEVRAWFERDMELALRFVETGDEAVGDERTREREAIRGRLQQEMDALAARADERIEATGDLTNAEVERCEDAILVRDAVLDACQGSGAAVCTEARSGGPGERYAFVDAPEDLWDVEQLRPWVEPTPLVPTPDGGLGGASTAALARRGNLQLLVGIEPLIRSRDALSEEELQGFDANLEALGFEFDDPRFAMAPALSVYLDIPEPLGGETHYLLHFRDLSDPPNDVVWTGVPTEGGVRAVFPAPPPALAALAAGEPLSMTAIRVHEGGAEADAVFTLSLTPVGQARAVSGLLSYLAGGLFAEHLRALIPPETGAGS